MAARLAVLAVMPLLAHCAAAPRLEGIEESHAIAPGDTTVLDRAIDAGLGDEPGVSAVRLLAQNPLAFGYRAATANSAERSLDLQYYIWNDDLTGKLLATEVMRAAERGVRVRVLVDDIDARAKHELFAVADLHPNIEVRIFNPFYSRSGWFGQVTEALIRGRRLNRRMHNKAWIVDNRIAIVGGRNIGDEYFGASEHSNFSDLDLVLAGPIVSEISASFDEYWNDPHAVPVDRFEGKPPPPEALTQLIADAKEYRQETNENPYVAGLKDVQRRADLLASQPPPLKVRDAKLLVDDPAKVGKDSGDEESRVLAGLTGVINHAQKEVLIVSAYFVPGKEGTHRFADLEKRNVRVAVLTNSLAATDVAAVHTGYARYRRELLREGVELFETKVVADSDAGRRQISILGSSGASLHTKAMIVDTRWVYIGSMNLDPRSATLNTEMGVLIDSVELARQVRTQFERSTTPELSYRVALEGRNTLVWYDRVNNHERRSKHEPDASWWRRIGVTLLRVLPIESQL